MSLRNSVIKLNFFTCVKNFKDFEEKVTQYNENIKSKRQRYGKENTWKVL